MKNKKIFIAVPFEKIMPNLSNILNYNMNIEIGLYEPEWFHYCSLSEIKKVAKILQKHNFEVTTHSAIYNLDMGSKDKGIKEYSKKCILKSLDISSFLKSKIMIIHTGFIPFIPSISSWEDICLKSLEEVVKKCAQRKIQLAIENLWEYNPTIIYNLIKKVKSEKIKICFDVGHFNIYSKVSLKSWLDQLGENIVVLHLHDNLGKVDEHNALGRGNVKFKKLFNELGKRNIFSQINLEVELKHIKKSISFLKKNKII